MAGSRQFVVNRLTRWILLPAAVFSLLGCGAYNNPSAGPITSTAAARPATSLSLAQQSFVYVLSGGGLVYGFSSSSSGALVSVAGSPYLTSMPDPDTSTLSISVDPANKFLFAQASSDSHLAGETTGAAFPIDQITGAPAGTPVATGGGSLAFHPSGRFFYNADRSWKLDKSAYGGIKGWNVPVTGSNFTKVPGSPFARTTQSRMNLYVEPTGHFLYAVALDAAQEPAPPSSLEIFAIDQGTGALGAGPIFAQTLPPARISFHPSGRFAYLSFFDTTASLSKVDRYSVDPANGALTYIDNQLSAYNLSSPVLHPGGKFLYVPCMLPAKVQTCQSAGYRIDGAGALTAIPGFNLGNVSGGPLVIEKTGRYAYVGFSQGATSSLSVFAVDPNGGSLVPLSSLAVPLPQGTSIANIAVTH